MRALVMTAYGDTDVLKVEDRPSPDLRPSDVRIEVKAGGLNFADVMARLGQYPHSPPPPSVTGYESAGVVTELGGEVSRFSVGDRVAVVTRSGSFAEELCVTEADVLGLPDAMSFAEGAAVPITYVTAMAALVTYGGLQEGERVLIHAAAGGVGTAAVQIARHVGAEVWGTASPSKHEAISKIGVHHPLDYTTPGWEQDLDGFDLVIDAIGGESFKRSYDLLRAGGRLVPFGAVSVFGEGARDHPANEDEGDFRLVGGLNTLNLMIDSKAVLGLDIRVLWDDRDTLRPWLAPLEPLLANGVISPIVAAEVPFDEASEAHRMLSDRRNVGKVVLVP